MTWVAPPGQAANYNAGKLKLAIFREGEEKDSSKVLETSDGFSVVAIPHQIKMGQPKLAAGKNVPLTKEEAVTHYRIEFGAHYPATYVSDSLNQDDLDQVTISEKIIVVVGEKNVITSGFLPGAERGHADDHTFPAGVAKIDRQGRRVSLAQAQNAVKRNYVMSGARVAKLEQYFLFSERRTGVSEADPKKVPESGFFIVMEQKRDVDGKWKIFVTKVGKENNGVQKGVMDPPSAAEPVKDPLE
jgi:hypothetical protein